MSLRRNILAGYAAQVYITAVGLLFLPLYLRYLGAEAYGLVGFFAMVQAWSQLLDVGLTPTLARETARHHAGELDGTTYRRLVRALEAIFVAVATVGLATMLALSGPVAADWLRVESLDLGEVRTALQLMAIAVALRWMAGLYRGCVAGAEQLEWLAAFGSLIATLRFVAVIAVFEWVGTSVVVFFTWQLLVAALELAGTWHKARSSFPALPPGTQIGVSFAPVRPLLGFALGIATTTGLWAVATQTDKLVLSSLLPLADYGYFTLAVLISTASFAAASPIANAVIPRLTALVARGDRAALVSTYRRATALTAVVSLSIAAVFAVFGDALLRVWSGSETVAERAAPILALYAIGYGLVAVSGMASHLQVAFGDLRLHVRGSIAYTVAMLAGLAVTAGPWGALGAGATWLAVNLAYLLLWIPRVHARLVPGLHRPWLLRDVGLPALAILAWCGLLHPLVAWPEARWAGAAMLGAIGLGALAAATLASRGREGFTLLRGNRHARS